MEHYGVCTDCGESHYLFGGALCYLCFRKALVTKAEETNEPAAWELVADLDDYVRSVAS